MKKDSRTTSKAGRKSTAGKKARTSKANARKKTGKTTKKKVTRKKAAPARKKIKKKAGKTAASRRKVSQKKTGKKAAARKTVTKKATKKAAARKKIKKKVSARPAGTKASGKKKPVRKSSRKTTTRKKVAARGQAPALLKRTPVTVTPVHAAAWRMHRQRLDEPSLHTPEDLRSVLMRTGWLSAPGGSSTPYLALAARFAAFSRHDLDRALFEEGRLVRFAAVRGETMVLPVEDAWIGLQAYGRRRQAPVDDLVKKRRLMKKEELANLEDVLRAVLAGRPLAPEALRERVPPLLVRELGDAGRKWGLFTTVDLAAWSLLGSGEVLARPLDHRLDRTRHELILRRDLGGPLVAADLRPRDEAIWLRALAERYFSWAGPARAADFAWWGDITVAVARKVMKTVDLTPVKLDGLGGDWFVAGEDGDVLDRFKAPDEPAVALVPFRDPLASTLKSFDGLVDPGDFKRPLVGWTGKPVPVSEAGPFGTHHHFVVIGGRVAGAWEHGPDGVLRYATFSDLPREVEAILSARAVAMAEFVRRELGEARFYAGEQGRSATLATASESWSGRAAAVAPRA